MIRNTFWFLSGMAFALVVMIYDGVCGPITIRRREPNPDEEAEPWFA